jgi:hypothetical protein
MVGSLERMDATARSGLRLSRDPHWPAHPDSAQSQGKQEVTSLPFFAVEGADLIRWRDGALIRRSSRCAGNKKGLHRRKPFIIRAPPHDVWW